MSRRVLFLTGCSLAILAVALVWVPPRESVVEPADSRVKNPARATPGARPVRAGSAAPGGLPAPLPSPHPAGSREHSEWVGDRCTELEELGWMDDEDSLKILLAELRNPEPEIREAALDAVGNFPGKEAIPHLQALAEECEDPAQKLALLQLAEELKIPTAAEYFSRKKGGAGEGR